MALIEIDDSMLLVIDAQESFYREHRIDVDRETLGRVFERISWVVGAAKALEVPVVVTEEDASRNGRTAANIRTSLAAASPILPKFAFSAPDNPEILASINATGASTTVLVGLETDVCVSHSALQLKALGHRVVAVHDALFSPQAAHANGLARMGRAGIELVSAKELVYDWVRTVENIRRFAQENPALAVPPGFSL
ncbi:isochorismatase family protein [Paenarthrobacter nitroguajacolicus]|uniref:isochorismatase family protein n=1 Tax=Paenarthrobacter nitroguajacolicus TaxID=211146 RepID=UPI000AF204B8|nr:isochorismatase family protein [Paenarthrobacter nitroguajacolicus]